MSIVINQRNVLDKMISGATNDLMREEMGKQLHGSHCSPQDTKCIDEHLNAHVNLPVSTLLAKLRDKHSARVAEMLHIYRFRHLRVQYEDLFLADSEDRSAAWRRVVHFLSLIHI